VHRIHLVRKFLQPFTPRHPVEFKVNAASSTTVILDVDPDDHEASVHVTLGRTAAAREEI
jgi:hypothetical protein